MKITNSIDRVTKHSSPEVNEKIRQTAMRAIEKYTNRPRAELEERLQELDREWDIERAIQANAASLSLVGLGLAATVDRKWLALPVLVAGFLLQHAIKGWCPPVPLLRRMGFRTPHEIEVERYALKLIKGDFGEFVKKSDHEKDAEQIYSMVSH